VPTLILEDLERDPHPTLARLRATTPVAWIEPLGGWIVTRRDLALAVMRDAAAFTVDDPRFSTAQVVGPSMLSLDGAEHARHRDPFARAFRLGPVRERFGGRVDAEARRLVANVAAAGRMDVRTTLSGPLAVTTVADLLGLVGVDPRTVLAWYAAIVDAVSAVTAGGAVTAAGREGFAALGAAVRASLGDATSLVAAARVAGLSVDEVVSNTAVLLFGGIETTDAMIANAIWHLLSTPGALDRVLAEPALLENAIEESLRLEPAAAVVDRYATRDVEIGGARVREGDLVVVSIAGANRDPATFPDPDVFDPSRANARLHAAFAQGPHVCLGMHLARLEAVAAVRAVLALTGLRLVAGAVAPSGLVFRKPATLPVAWDAQPR
jgi:cytochrome P450